MYKTRNFKIEELVHPKILRDIGVTNSWMRLDPQCLRDLDSIRDAWGDPIYINRGAADSRGLRPPDDPDGSFYSVHKQGKAFDLVPENGDVEGLYDLIRELIEDGALLVMNTLEDRRYTPTWVHVAHMNHDKKPLIIKP